MKEKGKLENLNKEIKNCKRCHLWRMAKNAVPGEGPKNAKIMIVGEAPGKEEDFSGRPFVGRAGKLLERLLEKDELKREEAFITSVVKHRPPQNRQPKKFEISACKPWLEKQIKIIRPKLIILLGRIASDTVLGKEFWRQKGKLLRQNDQKYFIVYHPAAALRFPKVKKNLEKDFKKIKRFL